jgi:hypothetical protein
VEGSGFALGEGERLVYRRARARSDTWACSRLSLWARLAEVRGGFVDFSFETSGLMGVVVDCRTTSSTSTWQADITLTVDGKDVSAAVLQESSGYDRLDDLFSTRSDELLAAQVSP